MWVTEVGRSWGGTRLVTRALRTSIIYWTSNSTKKVRELGWNLPEQVRLQADAIGELQLKRTQSGSCWNRGLRAAGADASGEQQLKRTETGNSSSAQRAVRCRNSHVGEQGGSSWASEASEVTCQYFKILTCVCLSMTEVGCSWGGTRL